MADRLTIADLRTKPIPAGWERTYGLELELECPRGANLLRRLVRHRPWSLEPQEWWRQVPEGSLQSGVEIVSPPRTWANTLLLLNCLRPTLEDPAMVISSWRAATQIHCSVEDFGLENLLLLMGYYIREEPRIFATVGRGRHESNFCVPWWTIPKIVLRMGTAVSNAVASKQRDYESTDLGAVVAQLNSWPKYTSLNLRTVLQYGTVESRHMETPSGAGSLRVMTSYFRQQKQLVEQARRRVELDHRLKIRGATREGRRRTVMDVVADRLATLPQHPGANTPDPKHIQASQTLLAEFLSL